GVEGARTWERHGSAGFPACGIEYRSAGKRIRKRERADECRLIGPRELLGDTVVQNALKLVVENPIGSAHDGFRSEIVGQSEPGREIVVAVRDRSILDAFVAVKDQPLRSKRELRGLLARYPGFVIMSVLAHAGARIPAQPEVDRQPVGKPNVILYE